MRELLTKKDNLKGWAKVCPIPWTVIMVGWLNCYAMTPTRMNPKLVTIEFA